MIASVGILIGSVGILIGSVGILIGSVGILIGSVGILIGSVGILIGSFWILNCRDYDCRDFDCRDFDTNPGGDQGPFETFMKIHPFWRVGASLSMSATNMMYERHRCSGIL